MPTLSIDDLTTPLTEDQVMATFISNLVDLGVRADLWRVGGVARTILRVVAKSYALYTVLQTQFIKSGFLDKASGSWLALLAHYVYNVDKIEATFATGAVTLVNSGGGLYTKNPGEYSVKSASSGKVYVNTATFTLNPNSTLTGVSIRAVEAGSASNAVPAGGGQPTIDTQVTSLLGVTVSNPSAIVGTDDEPDTTLRQRCRDSLGAASPNGPRGSYAFATRSALRDGVVVDINRIQVSPSSTKGIVDIWCASPSGAPISADLDAVVANIEAVSRPDTVTVNVHAATPVALSSSLTVWAYQTAGVSDDDISSAVDAALLAMVSTYPIGGVAKPPSTQGYLYQSKIEGTAEGAHPSIVAVDGVGGDLAINQGEVATLSVAITVRFVPQPPQ